MTQLRCPVDGCDRPRPGDRQVCRACEADLQRALAAVPELAAELDTTLARQKSVALGGGAGGGRERPLPYDPRASEAGWALRNTLTGWARILLGEYEEDPPGDALADLAPWLLARLQRLAGHAAAEEAVDEICAAVRAAWRAVDRAPDRQFAGYCPGCETALYVRPGAPQARCRDCDADPVDVRAQWDSLASQIDDQLFQAAMMAVILGQLGRPVPAGTIRRWAWKGTEDEPVTPRLLPRGYDRSGRPLYRVSDVLALREEGEERAAAKRGKAATERMAG